MAIYQETDDCEEQDNMKVTLRVSLVRRQLQTLFFGVAVGILAGFAGCMNDPNPVGVRILPQSDFLKIDTTTIFAEGSYSQEAIPSPATGRMLVGRNGSVEAWGVLEFSGLPDTLKDVQMVSAQVELRTVYHVGDSLSALSFTVHRILNDWKGDSLTVDSLTAPGFFQTDPVGSLMPGTVGDTASISVSIDTNLVRTWLKSVGDSVLTNHGVLFKPTNSSVIKGFATFFSTDESYRPRLLVLYSRPGTTRIDTARFNQGMTRFVAKSSTPIDLNDSTRIYVRNGLTTRGIIKFSAQALPPRSPIHRAVLELRLDPSLSILNSYTADSLVAYFVDQDGIIFGSSTISETRREGTSTVYRFQLGVFVQLWVRDPRYTSVAIGGIDESNALDVFVLRGSAAPADFKPKLTVVYSPMQ